MRVLFLLNTFFPGYVGGAEVSAYHAFRALQQRGVSGSMLVVNHRMFPQARDEHYQQDGIPVHLVCFAPGKRSAWRDLFDGRIYSAVRHELLREKPDVVHMHNVSGATLAPYLACRSVGARVVNTLHDLWLLCPNNMRYQADGTLCDVTAYRERCRACYRRYDYWGDVPRRRTIFKALTANVRLFLSPSRALIDQHLRAGYEARRFRHVPYGVPAVAGSDIRHAGVRQIVESADRYRTVVYAGGGTDIKGAAILQAAVGPMLRHVERLRVVVAGGGEARLLAPLSRFPQVHVLGPVPPAEMRALFACADLTITPSVWYENSPMVIQESFSVGTPVVATDIGGIPELVREGETGYLFPVGSGPRLAEKVIFHFSRPALARRRMRAACVAIASEQHSLERASEGILAAYAEALAG